MIDSGDAYYLQGRTLLRAQDVILSFGTKTSEQQQNQKTFQRMAPSGWNNTINSAAYFLLVA